MWGVFPTQFLSLNPILLSESKNSKNSGIFWNLWNLSVNMTYLAFLPKQDTFSTQIEVPGLILMSKRRNLRDSSNLEFILESLESRFQISEILQISPFWHQNRTWDFNLSGKSVLFGQKGQICHICREIPEIPKKFWNSWNFFILITELCSVTKIEWEKHPTLCFWPKMVEIWAKSEIGRFKSAEIGQTS